MKGTFFSADFIKDANGDLRLLELNTDTAIVPDQISSVNWQPFLDVLSANSLTDIHIIYKPVFHSKLVTQLSDAISNSGISGVTVSLHSEDQNTIYPTVVEDAANKFVLRLVYDESAIFDSEYCRDRVNTYILYYDNSEQNFVTEFYYSSSLGVYDSLSKNINPLNIPDVSVKDTTESFNPINFYKLGYSEFTNTERWDGFINEVKSEDKIIEQFHFHSSSVDGNNHLTSYRTFFIVYGPDLTTINIHSYKNTTMFDLPVDISEEVSDIVYGNKLGDYHYYEYTTNSFKVDGAGLLSTDKIQMADDTYKALGDIEVGEKIKSFFISGSPQIENDYDTMNWSYEGSSFPSGSYVTSSTVVFKNTEYLHYNALLEFVVDGDSQFAGTSKQFLVYDSSSNSTSYKHAVELDPSIHYFYTYNGGLVDLDEANYYVTSDANIQIVELDVEDTDTYIISGSTAFNAVVSHNNPCFVAGTKITLKDGTQSNIEDVVIGTEVLTFNFTAKKVESRKVQGVNKKIVSRAVKYTFDNGTSLTATHDHPLYAKDKQWVSSDPQFTFTKYQLHTNPIEIGDQIFKLDGTYNTVSNIEEVNESVVVYNLVAVESNHNFYANEFLVHNRCFVAGTEISLLDDDVKNIEDVQVGEEVITYNEETGLHEVGVVGELKQHQVDSVIRLTLDNENVIVTTHEHPFFVEGKGWVKAGELEPLDVCKKIDGGEALISSVEELKETHTVYNLLSVSKNHNFYANGILVHNK